MGNIILQLNGIGMQYGPNIVLHDITMEIGAGEVIGLVGENGAGKSTLLKILSGLEKPSFGTMMLKGQSYAPKNILDGNRHGIGMVFQEQSVIKNWTIAENIYIGRESKYKKGPLINKKRMNSDAEKVLNEFGVKQVPETKVQKLDFSSRQMIEIAKTFDSATDGHENAIILLDEPTSVLTHEEISRLFSYIRKMKEQGHTIVFVSHRLDEVIDISDYIYVLKDGEKICKLEKEEAKLELLYEKMTGRETTGEYYKESRQILPSDDIVMEARNLSMFGYFRDISFKLRKGEILGFCGLEGSGVDELCAVLSGLEDYTSGELCIPDKDTQEFKKVVMASPKDAVSRQKIISVPKNRNAEGVIGKMELGDNIVMSNLKAASRFGLISNSSIRNLVKEWVSKLRIVVPDLRANVAQLSGGNAQKIVFARVMYSDADIFILNHASRGVDIGAKEEIYALIRDVTEQGGSAIFVGDTLDESIGLCSRLIVMKDGLIQKEFDTPVGNKPSQVDVVRYML